MGNDLRRSKRRGGNERGRFGGLVGGDRPRGSKNRGRSDGRRIVKWDKRGVLNGVNRLGRSKYLLGRDELGRLERGGDYRTSDRWLVDERGGNRRPRRNTLHHLGKSRGRGDAGGSNGLIYTDYSVIDPRWNIVGLINSHGVRSVGLRGGRRCCWLVGEGCAG